MGLSFFEGSGLWRLSLYDYKTSATLLSLPLGRSVTDQALAEGFSSRFEPKKESNLQVLKDSRVFYTKDSTKMKEEEKIS